MDVSDAGAAGPSTGAATMNLKGQSTISAIGRCVSVLYDEGGPELVAYRGVVVYCEPHRRARPPPPRSRQYFFFLCSPAISTAAVLISAAVC